MTANLGRAALVGGIFIFVPSLDASAVPISSLTPRVDKSVKTMLVCTADGCRHRFNSYRARPEWNRYMLREHAPEREAAPVADLTPASPAASRKGERHR